MVVPPSPGHTIQPVFDEHDLIAGDPLPAVIGTRARSLDRGRAADRSLLGRIPAAVLRGDSLEAHDAVSSVVVGQGVLDAGAGVARQASGDPGTQVGGGKDAGVAGTELDTGGLAGEFIGILGNRRQIEFVQDPPHQVKALGIGLGGRASGQGVEARSAPPAHEALDGGIYHAVELTVDQPQHRRVTQLADFIPGFHAPTLARALQDAHC